MGWQKPEHYELADRTVATLRSQGVPNEVIVDCYSQFVCEAMLKHDIQEKGCDYYEKMHLRQCQQIIHNHVKTKAERAQIEREIQASIPWYARSRKKREKKSSQKKQHGAIARFFRNVTGVDMTPAEKRASTPRIFHWMIQD